MLSMSIGSFWCVDMRAVFQEIGSQKENIETEKEVRKIMTGVEGEAEPPTSFNK